MKKALKKSSAILAAIMMVVCMTACGSGVDTKETVQKTVDDLQVKMAEVTAKYQNTFSDAAKEAATDPDKAKELIDQSITMIDEGIAACDSVEAPGPDSQKYRDICKGLFEVIKDMMNDYKSIDMTDSSAISDLSQKYMSQILAKSTEAMTVMKDLSEKYGITMPTSTTTQQ